MWVNIPHEGYVGVGIVEGAAQIVTEFKVRDGDREVPILEAETEGAYHNEFVEDEDMAEYFVPVRWLKAVARGEAYSEVGFFGNQNTVARPTAERWGRTVGRLRGVFGV